MTRFADPIRVTITEFNLTRREVSMSRKLICVSTFAALAALALPGPAPAQQGANLSGAYRCVPEPSPCQWPGETMSITQSGSTLELKHQDAEIAEAKLTSNITISGGPPWNSNGIVLPDHSIQWSNGTLWRKQ
jgi:hypothetical protein